MYDRIKLFINDFNLIFSNQFGFRKKYSTNHALLSIVEQIRKNLDNKIFSCGIFVDLEKAFDTVNHHILVDKLDHYGIRGVASKWISSYLSNRKQHVKLNSVKSNDEKVTCGVPQGSIIGPLLFIIYINDMHNALNNSTGYHFADDTNLLCSSKEQANLYKIANKELRTLYEWLCVNRLSLNVAKTEFIIFRPTRSKIDERVTLKLAGIKLFESTKIKYLGIILDSRLTWKHHVHELCKKLNRAVGMIYKIRDYCNKNVLRSLYFSLFNSHLTYGLPAWGECDTKYSNKLLLLQKKIVRSISFADFNAPTDPLFKELKILKFHDLYKCQLASLMWDYDKGTLPESLNPLFTKRSDVHSLNLRNARDDRLYIARKQTTRFGINSFSHKGSLLLNELKDLEIYNRSVSKMCFLKKYKKSIFESY